MAQLNQPDRPIATAVQVGGEVAQDSIGVLIAFIDEGGKIALRVEHEVPSSWTLIGRWARGETFSSCASCCAFRAVLLANRGSKRTTAAASRDGPCCLISVV
jgi:hypothetical protein